MLHLVTHGVWLWPVYILFLDIVIYIHIVLYFAFNKTAKPKMKKKTDQDAVWKISHHDKVKKATMQAAVLKP